jgi:hypothetical protein
MTAFLERAQQGAPLPFQSTILFPRDRVDDFEVLDVIVQVGLPSFARCATAGALLSGILRR